MFFLYIWLYKHLKLYFMKLTDLFKKSKIAQTKIESIKIDKKQLEKIIGGAEDKVVEKATSGLKDVVKTQV